MRYHCPEERERACPETRPFMPTGILHWPSAALAAPVLNLLDCDDGDRAAAVRAALRRATRYRPARAPVGGDDPRPTSTNAAPVVTTGPLFKAV